MSTVLIEGWRCGVSLALRIGTRGDTMRSFATIFVVAAFLGVCAPTASAQRRASLPQMYDTSTEVTIRGTVQEVKQVPTGMGRRNLGGTHLLLKTDTDTVEVHLGPSTFLAEQKLVLAAGDALVIVGSRVTVSGAPAILAREVRKGDQVVVFRDAQGFPKWSSRGRR